MDASTVPVAYLPSAAPAGATPAAPPASPSNAEKQDNGGGGLSFGDVLSALNPLQYLPVIGTIYRAVTGDTIPEGLRIAGSFAVSALMGGPFGVLLNAATTVAERLTGIDPESIAHDVAASLGLGPATPAATSPAPTKEAGVPPPALIASATDTVTRVTSAMSDLAEGWPNPDPRRLAGLASYARFAIA